ncbi:MAG: hypothetical protein C0392_05560 [Syntrophus sp. (in: bacteria)]|nr:hypothetical protein [Syntrophus sp. (in: bacteria)]
MNIYRSRRVIVYTTLISIACVLLILTGCADFKKKTGTFLGGDSGEQPMDSRDEAIGKYNYKSIKDEIILGSPSIIPDVARIGDTITQTMQYVVLSPEKNKSFKVQEVVTLSGKGILLELSRKEIEKMQGTHTSTVQFTIPNGLARGSYKLITTISTAGMEKKQTGSFRVK